MAEAMSKVNSKLELHTSKKIVLQNLFNTMLHKLMTGEVRVKDVKPSSLQSHLETVSE